MSRIEQGYVLRQNEGLVDKYKNFNKLTRNIGLGVLGGALLFGASGIATIAALSVVVDQAQIVIIDKYKKWRNKSSYNNPQLKAT